MTGYIQKAAFALHRPCTILLMKNPPGTGLDAEKFLGGF